ncbi:NlpC/P60 family protein [Clostridium thermarum]|uniref:C40 family peptidase n=1 Tax=Clostridium thermarum TaxID=1716543 RepID=UPI00112189FD|nr:C40 family peptidase [Clostridium thermarum]
MLKKKNVITALVVTLLMSTTVSYAEPLTEKLNKEKQQLQQDKRALQEVEDKREEIEIELENLDVKIEETMALIEEYKERAVKIQEEKKVTENNIVQAELEVQKEQDMLDKRLSGIYKSGQASYLSIILKAESFRDLISRVEAVRTIAEYDQKMIAKVQEKRNALEEHKKELAAQENEVLTLQKESERKLQEIKETIAVQKKLVEELKEQERIFAARVRESQALVDATTERINAIREQAPKYVPSRGAANLTSNNVLAYASNFLGTPYVWGGTTPDPGFDCSGFTRYVYAHFGVYLGRTTKDQIKNGVEVSKADLKPGDLVFFGKNGVPNHVGIYVGDNAYIHAPRTGDVVKISAMTRKDFITGRRVM